MYLSVFMGPFSRSGADDLPLIDLCLRQAQAAAAAGFAMVTFGEQHFNNYEPYCNPFLMAARLSPDLGDAYFGTTIVPLPLQQTLRLAENANIIDLLTRGRFIMGLSAGRVGFSPDFRNFGIDPDKRHEIFDAKFDLLLRAQEHRPDDPPLIPGIPGDAGELNGRLMPISYRAGGPLLAIGSNTDAVIEKAGTRGRPVFLGPCLPSDAARKFALHRTAMTAAGFADEHVALQSTRSLVTRHVIVGRSEDEAWDMAERMAGANPMMDRSGDPRTLREMAAMDLSDLPAGPAAMADPLVRNAVHVQSWIIAGDPGGVAEQIREYPERGIPHLNVRFTVGPYDPDLFDRSFQLFAKEVMPGLAPQTFAAPAGEEIRPEHRGEAR
ncbi:LLM class flavin-dependent oxidoreductase [Actinomadura sp. LD22]|uniref:LLM class flavin-dependent oxidoreductase n=1 Tax=Actinomadura physcomitrii TaxID=2650748 RepID=A0A6I4MNJ7_9ACTN|nr:LLM class flavin-dependent oxidoreductase [Actinomadura physcomitrii]MWA05427.1 LLM class flavin-dependent oxidoreductase [Actinomadura physcomitrii]